jgi:UDP-N-acetylmuramoyl-L-alanyl-D-glutamate--2,6-diaminopimelate ligase
MYELVNRIVRALKTVVPTPIVTAFRTPYHALLTLMMAAYYGFPARKLTVIGVTGTKGKSTVAEMLFASFRAAGHKTALISTIRFAIDDASEPNRYKMTLQGRGFAQAFMQRALAQDCTHLVIEVTSESTLQFRHWFLSLDGLVVTNIQKEHIESHGSFAKYVAAKRTIVRTLARSRKHRHILVSNENVPETKAFLDERGVTAIGFSEHELKDIETTERKVRFIYDGTAFSLPLPGVFNAMNALATIKMGEAFGVARDAIVRALSGLPPVRGRVEHIDAGQTFLAIVDYAHTPDSLKALYGAFEGRRKICVLGNTGGGRDTWKRPVMGNIAAENCDEVILTNEDPYDEDPEAIIAEMAEGMERAPTIILDRREAIRNALARAKDGDVVLVSGKGTDPFIMGPQGTKIPWSDAEVVRDELTRLLAGDAL